MTGRYQTAVFEVHSQTLLRSVIHQ